MYHDEYHPKIRKDLKKLDPKLRQIIETEYIPDILSSPEKGELLVGDLRDIEPIEPVADSETDDL